LRSDLDLALTPQSSNFCGSLRQSTSGTSPKTLADTLKQLREEELLKREAFAEIPPRVEYSLTKDGEGIREAVIPILKRAATRQCSKKKCSAAYNKIPAHRIKNRATPEKGPSD